MSTPTFVPPTPILRHVTRQPFSFRRVVHKATLNGQRSDHLARLLHMKEDVAERLQSLQSAAKPPDDNSSPSQSNEQPNDHDGLRQIESIENNGLSPRHAPDVSKPTSTPTVNGHSSNANGTSKTSTKPTVILRHDVYLPWKSQRKIPSSQNPPIEVTLPHIDAFRKGGLTIPAPAIHADRPVTHSVSSASQEESQASSELVERIVSGLNEKQREAVVTDSNRACLVLAGPGSGKTRVLTHRIAYLIKACGASPYSILSVTFTNNAAAEMRARVQSLLNEFSDEEYQVMNPANLTVGTFHWVGARLLRMYGEHIGISSDFDICDQQDSRSIISRLLNASKADGESADSSQVTMSAALISKLKNDKEEELRKRMPGFIENLLTLRNDYNARLRSMNMLDFDDLLVETRRMLRDCPDVCRNLQNRFQHVLVDEWQDTNNVQFDIVSLLTGERKNLFVVGDVDQSIYKFRGADSGNMQRYTQIFEDAKQIMLVKNYRSTRNIISAAQAVIEQDRSRPKKDMITDNRQGDKVNVVSVPDGRLEAQLIVSSIIKMKRQGDISSFTDCAIMYRTNAQSRLIEEACVQARIPYLLQSGTRFFDRKEIKDLVAYLKVLVNPWDDNAVLRIINVPSRGIGKRTIERIEMYSQANEKGIMESMDELIENPDLCADASIRPSEMHRLKMFSELIEQLRRETIQAEPENSESQNVGTMLIEISNAIAYESYLDSLKDNDRKNNMNKAQDRKDNVEELILGASKFQDVSVFLERVTLMSEAGAQKEKDSDGAVWLTTLHGSKGLEFPAVFITGAEDGIIPLIRDGSAGDIEEERRLLYVGMTRAKQFLNISWRSRSMSRKNEKANKELKLSRFLSKVGGLERSISALCWP